MSMIVPLGLDLSNFEKELKRAGALIDKFGMDVDKAKNLKPTTTNADGDIISITRTKKAKDEVDKLEGSMQKIRDTQKSIVTYAESFNLKTAAGQKSLAKSYNQWSQIEKSIGSSSVSFEKLYKMQQEYQKLTWRKYDISNTRAGFAQIQGLEGALQQARLTSTPKTLDEISSKIRALQNAQNGLNLLTSEGRRKFSEYEKEINKSKKSIEELTGRKQKLVSVASELQSKIAAVFGARVIADFYRKIVDIGGEFEKQQVALSSIVGDISKANVLFSQLKTQALESPFTFKNLIDGTRQLAAYNIEAEKLYDTQFMLTELSAGLGVEMSRLVLAFGQVKAASVLRGQELRQFTEAGIPMVQALADKFTALEGRLVSTGEVFERISNRMVSFEMVNDVLREMTEEGGKFYRMQEKQAETLYGQMNNVKDAIDIMFMDIAKENNGMLMSTIKLFRLLLENWRDLAVGLNVVIGLSAAYYGYNLLQLPKIIAGTAKYQKLLMDAAKAQALLKTVTLGFYAALGVAIVLATSHLINMSLEMKRFGKQMSEIRQRNAADMKSESRELESLINKLDELSVGSNEYIKVKEKIATQFGEYFPRIIQETDGVRELREMYSSATSALSAYYAEKARYESEEAIKSDKGIARRRSSLVSGGTRFLSTGIGLNRETGRSIMEDFVVQITDDIMTLGKVNGTIESVLEKAASRYGVTLKESMAATKLLAKEAMPLINSLMDRTNYTYDQMAKAEGAFSKRALEIKKFLVSSLEQKKAELEASSQLSTGLVLDYDLEKERLAFREKANKLAVMAVQELEESFAKQGRGGLGQATAQKFATALVTQANYRTNDSTVNQIFTKYQKSISEMYSAGSPIQKQTADYFKKVSESLKREESQLNKNNKAEVEAFKIKNNAAKAVRNLAASYRSLDDAYALIESRDASKNQLLRLEAQLASGSLSPDTKSIVQQQYKEEKAKLDAMNSYIKAMNLVEKAPKTTDGKVSDPIKEELKELKNQSEGLIKDLSNEVIVTASVNGLLGIIEKLKAARFGNLGKELIDELQRTIDENAIKVRVNNLELRESKAQERFGMSSEFSQIKKDTGIDLSALYPEMVMSFTEYTDEMMEIRKGYLAADVNEIAKANKNEQAVRKVAFDEFVRMIKETAALNEKYGSKEEKLKMLQDSGLAIEEEYTTVQEKLTVVEDEGERMRLELHLKYLELKKKANADEVLLAEADVFKTSQLYKDLYDDITDMAVGARKRQLREIKKALEPIATLQGGEKSIVQYGDSGDTKLKMTPKEAADALRKVDKELAKLAGNNLPLKQLGVNMKDAFGGGGIDFDSFGAGLQNIGQIGEMLTPLLDVFNADQYTKDMTEGIIGGVSALGRIAANPADIGAYVELITNLVKVFDADNSKRILEHVKAIESLNKAYADIEDSLESTIGLEGYQDRLMIMMDNLNTQVEHYREMISEERAKKATDSSAIEEYENKIEEAEAKRANFIKSTVAEMGTTIKSAASQFASDWENAFLETGNGMSAFEDSFDNMMRNIIRKQIQMKYIEKALAPTIAAIERAVDPYGEGGIGITKNEIDSILANKGISKNSMSALNSFMEDLYSSMGLTSGSGVFDTLTKGIQGITENSAQVIASYLNSIRLEVHLIRLAVENRSTGVSGANAASNDSGVAMMNMMGEYYPQYLTNLIAIRDNTNYLRDAYDFSVRGFRVS